MDKVGFKITNVNFKQNSIPENKQNLSSPIADKEKSNAAKYAIGATALAAIVVAGIATKGKLWGKTLEKSVAEAQPPKTDNLVMNEEAREVYSNIKQKLDGSITCKVKNEKSNELKELAEYYHSQVRKMEKIKEELKKEKILDYQIEFKKNKVTVENGEIKKLINENGESWQITKATDKDFVKELNQAINNENDKRVIDELSTRYLEAEEKSVKLKKVESDKLNEKWLENQHQIKEKEYGDLWNRELAKKEKDTLLDNKINLYANGLKLDEEVVANGQKFVFTKGKLEKVLDANNKEIKIDKNVTLAELESILRKKYEVDIVVPKLKKQIENTTKLFSEEMKNIKNIYKDIISAGAETGETKITKEVAGKKYTFDINKYRVKVSVTNKNGHELKFRFDDETVIMNDGKNKYQFIDEKDKYKLIMMNRDINSCNVGDIYYYRIPHYESNNQAEVSYKMPIKMDMTAYPPIVAFGIHDFFYNLK